MKFRVGGHPWPNIITFLSVVCLLHEVVLGETAIKLSILVFKYNYVMQQITLVTGCY